MCRSRAFQMPKASSAAPTSTGTQATFRVASGLMRSQSQSPAVSLPASFDACSGVNL